MGFVGKAILMVMVVVILMVGIAMLGRSKPLDKLQLWCDEETLFEKEKENANRESNAENEAGIITSLYEDFDQYGDVFSRSIEDFEELAGVKFAGEKYSLTKKEKQSGNYGLLIESEGKEGEIIVRKEWKSPKDLSQWADAGFISMWINLEQREGILSVQISAEDSDGSRRVYRRMDNIQTNIPNFYNEDSLFPDIEYPAQASEADEWVDFILMKGWNYIPWRMDEGHYKDEGDVDLSAIKAIEISIEQGKQARPQKIILDDIRVQDGLQRENNILDGKWYPPLGRPQYGIYDLEEKKKGDYVLKLLNVRQAQYPSNGDHGRMISRQNVPMNFAAKMRFTLVDLAEKEDRQNTWLRMMYDFEPEYDPGHDWFGVYLSMEWNKFGLVAVIPVERFFLQDKEPRSEEESPTAAKDFEAWENQEYEIDLIVKGQNAQAIIYEANNDCIREKEEVEYVFKRLRYSATERYPLAVEITGNVHAEIQEIEVVEINE